MQNWVRFFINHEAHEDHEENTKGGRPNVVGNGCVLGIGKANVKN